MARLERVREPLEGSIDPEYVKQREKAGRIAKIRDLRRKSSRHPDLRRNPAKAGEFQKV